MSAVSFNHLGHLEIFIFTSFPFSIKTGTTDILSPFIKNDVAIHSSLLSDYCLWGWGPGVGNTVPLNRRLSHVFFIHPLKSEALQPGSYHHTLCSCPRGAGCWGGDQQGPGKLWQAMALTEGRWVGLEADPWVKLYGEGWARLRTQMWTYVRVS